MELEQDLDLSEVLEIRLDVCCTGQGVMQCTAQKKG